jgi:hypothetical protein
MEATPILRGPFCSENDGAGEQRNSKSSEKKKRRGESGFMAAFTTNFKITLTGIANNVCTWHSVVHLLHTCAILEHHFKTDRLVFK